MMLRGQRGQFEECPVFLFYYSFRDVGSLHRTIHLNRTESTSWSFNFKREIQIFCYIYLLHHCSQVKLVYCDSKHQRSWISEVLCGASAVEMYAWKTISPESKTSENQKLCTHRKLSFFMSCVLAALFSIKPSLVPNLLLKHDVFSVLAILRP